MGVSVRNRVKSGETVIQNDNFTVRFSRGRGREKSDGTRRQGRWRFVCEGPGFTITGNPAGHTRQREAIAEFQAMRFAMLCSKR